MTTLTPNLPLTPLIFWQHGVAVTIPNAVWSPLPWNLVRTQRGAGWSAYVAGATTIAAGSHLAALPQATINVADAGPLAPAGYVVIRIGGTDRVVQYTGKTATTLTGCTGGVGTMSTGDAVAQAQVDFDLPPGLVGPATAEVAWASNATGRRGIRFRDFTGPFFFGLGTTVLPAAAMTAPSMHIQTTEQPVWSPAGVTRVEVFQDSGGPLDSVLGELFLDAPRLVVAGMGRYNA